MINRIITLLSIKFHDLGEEMKNFNSFLVIILAFFMLFACTSSKAQKEVVKSPSSKTEIVDAKSAVKYMLSEKNRIPINRYSVTGEAILRFGSQSVSELISALELVPEDDKGYIALALGLFRKQATDAVPKLIEYFPLKPEVETDIYISNQKSQIDVKLLIDKWGPGSLVAQSTGSETRYFYLVKVPAAVSALREITGVYVGKTQQEWKQWSK